MRRTYDPKVDAFYHGFWKPPKGRLLTRAVGDGIGLDFTGDGQLVGIEVLNASAHFPKEVLAAMAAPSHPMTLTELEAEFGLSAVSWRAVIGRERVAAKKVGRDWLVERVDAVNYLASRDSRGAPPSSKKARRKTAKAGTT